MTETSRVDKYIKMFEKEMAQIDPLQQVVLKGHLIIEVAIDNIISTMFFHPEHVFKGRFTFTQKLQMARAYGLRKDKNTMWNIILTVNEVRNEIAHNLADEKRDTKLKQLRRLLLLEVTDEMRANLESNGGSFDGLSDEEIVFYSCVLCTGFLGAFEEDAVALRRLIGAIDQSLNPDQERIPYKTPAEARKKK